jgi:hypothetical protein
MNGKIYDLVYKEFKSCEDKPNFVEELFCLAQQLELELETEGEEE